MEIHFLLRETRSFLLKLKDCVSSLPLMSCPPDCSVPAALSSCPHVGERRVQVWSLLTSPNTSGCIKHQPEHRRGGAEFPSTGSAENPLTMKRRSSRLFLPRGDTMLDVERKTKSSRVTVKLQQVELNQAAKTLLLFLFRDTQVVFVLILCTKLYFVQDSHQNHRSIQARVPGRLNVLQTSSGTSDGFSANYWITPCTFTCTLIN